MTAQEKVPRIRLGRSDLLQLPLGMGGSYYGLDPGQGEPGLRAALTTALEHGVTHFDTATDYGDGQSERLLGRFLAAKPARRTQVFLASKVNPDEPSAHSVVRAIEASLRRLQTDVIDLYYLHWPRSGLDLRPWMEGLETARQRGLIRATGVSNFSVAQMKTLGEAGQIDVCQVGYNLLWRFAERELLPYCTGKGIQVVAYSALAHGILSGRYPRHLEFAPGDQRWGITLFRPDVWPQVHRAVETFVDLAGQGGFPLATLALRWVLRQPAIHSVLVSAPTEQMVMSNLRALVVDIPGHLLDELGDLSEKAMQHVPDEGNPFGYHP